MRGSRMGALLLFLVIADSAAVGYLLAQDKAIRKVLAAQSDVLAEYAKRQDQPEERAYCESASE